MEMSAYTTKLGSLENYEKGSIQIIQGEATNYAFSNIFEVAAMSKPYEKTVVGMNLKFVIESVLAEGQSAWYTASHDEFVIVMDGGSSCRLFEIKRPNSLTGSRGYSSCGRETRWNTNGI